MVLSASLHPQINSFNFSWGCEGRHWWRLQNTGVSTAPNNVLKYKTSSADYRDWEENKHETVLYHRPVPRNCLSLGRHLATQKLQLSPTQLQNTLFSCAAKLNQGSLEQVKKMVKKIGNYRNTATLTPFYPAVKLRKYINWIVSKHHMFL